LYYSYAANKGEKKREGAVWKAKEKPGTARMPRRWRWKNLDWLFSVDVA